jgi:hypothetical protein
MVLDFGFWINIQVIEGKGSLKGDGNAEMRWPGRTL